MGRTKAQPKRKARTITISGAAAHAALASALPDDEVTAIVTPIREKAAAAEPKSKQKKRRLKKSNTRHDDEDGDEDLFEIDDNKRDGVIASRQKRVRFACDQVTRKARRRLIFDDDDEDGVLENTSKQVNNNESSGSNVTIQATNDGTIIGIPSNAYQQSKSTAVFELMQIHLPNTKMVIVGSNGSDSGDDGLRKVTLNNTCDIEYLLYHCVNQSLNGGNESIDVTSILRAVENEVLEIVLQSTTHHQINVSINLLQFDSLHDERLSARLNVAPPIPAPRLLPRNRKNKSRRFSKPHPSYSLIQALAGVFKGSIFDDVAKSCFVSESNSMQEQAKSSQKQTGNKSVITAKMVYSVVDNANAREYEPSSVIGSSPSDSKAPLTIPGLVPTLRPYQEAAVRWMIQRETEQSDAVWNDEWELCWFVIVQNTATESDCEGPANMNQCNIVSLPEWKRGKSAQDERQLFCNPFAGWIATKYEDAKFLMFGASGEDNYHSKGGILAESMGLGKTVEVIACMLANPSPLAAVVNNDDCGIQPQLSPSDHSDEAVRIYRSKTIIKSRATLIVTPPSILTQWEREIGRHTKNLKVIVYPGMKDLCSRSSPTSHKDSHLVNPRVLADADVVLVTFQTLNNDIGHSDDNPYTGDGGRLRRGKRHIVVPSPLSSIEWHRVCLDEAQRVEAPTTASARMARKLITERRWCVSGTPIGRHNLNDLYGLFLFLSFRPFHDKDWFMNSFLLSQGGAMKRLSHLLRKVMWRSTKQNSSVREQMGIPEQEEKKVMLHFSSIEKYFYNKQYEEAIGAVQRWSAAGRPDKLHLALNKLRAACCHPQVGASGLGGRSNRQHGSSSVLTMEEILNKLIEDSKGRVEEAQRLFVMHTNGMACLSKLKAKSSESSETKKMHMEKSLSTYLEAIDMMNKSSSPTILHGSGVLGGSPGFRMSGKKVSCDAVVLDWQTRPVDSGNISKAWSVVNFTSSKRVSCVKIRPIKTLPSELRDNALNWTILQPKECILQISGASDGGDFVDAGSITLTNADREEDSWAEISGFRANKSKACRVLIKSYHESSTHMQSHKYYVGVEAQFFEPRISDDPLQRLHTLHNASMVLSSMLQEDDNTKASSSDERARLERMESEGQSIHDNYMAHARAIHCQRKYQLSASKLAWEECNKELNAISKGSNQDWYDDALGWFSVYGKERQQREMCETVADELRSYYDNMSSASGVSELDQVLIRRGRFPGFNDVRGLNAALQMRLQQGRDEVGSHQNDDQKRCLHTVMKLSSDVSSGEVLENSQCQRCRSDWQQTGPVCKHCHLEDDLVKLEKLSNDPEISCVLKAITKVVKSQHASESNAQHKSFLRSLHRRAARYSELHDLLKDMIKAAKAFWRAHFDLLSDIDEMNQCKRSMRLRRHGEDVSTLTDNESAFIVDHQDIAAEYFDHEAKQALALAEMKRSEDSMRFLMNQSSTSRESNICTICLTSFQDERSVLSCGHSFHPECVENLFGRFGGGIIRCPMRCPMTTSRADLLLASNKSREDGSQACHEVKGDYGTKVNRLVGDVLDTIQLGDKGLILSQWEDMLDIVAEALKENSIKFVRPKGGKQFGQDVRLFRSSDYPILLLNVKNGAEGLTLVEANHAFMLEPILNHSIDAQAINRIHRIGQTSKTYVHRYIIADTVEEKIDIMRMEREANHFEDDIVQERKDHFDRNEIDQIFGWTS